MLEQWEGDRLLVIPKVYSHSTVVDLSMGADDDYALESDDGTEFFLLDIYRPTRNKRKVRFQLRYQRDVILARLCTSVPHTNPDGERIGFPHLHAYREHFDDRFAEQVEPFGDLSEALKFFCNRINLPMPDTQGGVS